MATDEQIYNFETTLENAVKAILVAAGLTCYASEDAAATERTRPRVEIMFTPGAASDHLQLVGSERRCDSFSGSLILSAITDMKDGIASHMTYRAALRSIGARLIYSLDATALPYHEVHDIAAGGSTPTISPAEGVWESRQLYNVKFNIKQSAWE
jgi:hypothetical protein